MFQVNWIVDRKQKVTVDGNTSDWKPVLSEAPQGSVLGPLLFLAYINDLDSTVLSQVLKLTDGTELHSKVNSSNNDNNLQKELEKPENWLEK